MPQRSLSRLPRRHGDSDDATAFLPDPRVRAGRVRDDLAEALAEEYVWSATSAEGQGEELRAQELEEELGGPFVVTKAARQFARGTDPSNPPGAEKAAFPLATSSFED